MQKTFLCYIPPQNALDPFCPSSFQLDLQVDNPGTSPSSREVETNVTAKEHNSIHNIHMEINNFISWLVERLYILLFFKDFLLFFYFFHCNYITAKVLSSPLWKKDYNNNNNNNKFVISGPNS